MALLQMTWRMVLGLCLALVGLSGHTRATEPTLTIGSKAPPIDIEHWIQTRGGHFQPVKECAPGKVTVIEFWATWCGPCVASMPHLAAIQDTFVDKGVTIVSVSDEGVETIEALLDRKLDGEGDTTYRALTNAYCLTTDPDRSVHKDYLEAAGERGIPTAFIVGKTGEIEWIGHPASLMKPLEQVLDGTWDRAAHALERQFETRRIQLSTLLRQGKGVEAMELFDALMAAAPTEEAKARLRAIHLEVAIGAGGPAALEALNAAVKAADGSVHKLNEAAWTVVSIVQRGIHADADVVTAAVAAANEATRLDPARGDVRDTLAHLYEIQGDLAQALATQREAVRHAPGAVKEQMDSYLRRLEKKALIGSKAPSIDIEHWVQHRKGSSTPVKEFTPGTVYLIACWRTSCGSCVETLQHLAHVQDDYADKGVTVISVSDEDLDTITNFLEQKVDRAGDTTFRDLTKAYCLTTDPDRSVFKDYMAASGEQGIPTAFIVGPTGEIEWLGHPEQMDVPLEKVVAGQWDRSLFDQNFTGRIGVGIAMREPRPEITHVVPDSPAARAGLVLGLIIDTVDGKETQGLDLPTVLKMVSGRHGTKIRLGLIDPQTDEPRTVEVVREWMRF